MGTRRKKGALNERALSMKDPSGHKWLELLAVICFGAFVGVLSIFKHSEYRSLAIVVALVFWGVGSAIVSIFVYRRIRSMLGKNGNKSKGSGSNQG